MITENQSHKRVKAVGLISGGLDSTLAAKLMADLGVEVHGVFFAMPWGCCDKAFAQEAAENIGIPLIVLQLDERYLEVVRSPKHGRGRAMNPCVDCRIHMFSRAAQYMRHIGADFIFTGEVLGQRPMSQKRQAMEVIERETGLEGKILRPLSAQYFPPTICEEKGWINRDQLLNFTGRSRKKQYELARELQVKGYSAPAGGCNLTDENFSRRMKDVLDYGYRNFRETIALKWGRHFRMKEKWKIILGRDKAENENLIRYAYPDDIIIQLEDNLGPTLILKGEDPSEEILQKSAALIQFYSRYKEAVPQPMRFWKAKEQNQIQKMKSVKISEKEVEEFSV